MCHSLREIIFRKIRAFQFYIHPFMNLLWYTAYLHFIVFIDYFHILVFCHGLLSLHTYKVQRLSNRGIITRASLRYKSHHIPSIESCQHTGDTKIEKQTNYKTKPGRKSTWINNREIRIQKAPAAEEDARAPTYKTSQLFSSSQGMT